MKTEFWQKLEMLLASSTIIIDRPRGSTHPTYADILYPFDYGYLKDTAAMDRGGIDIWIGSLQTRRIDGIICTVDLKKADAEVKILCGCTAEDVRTILAVHNQFSQGGIWIPHPDRNDEFTL